MTQKQQTPRRYKSASGGASRWARWLPRRLSVPLILSAAVVVLFLSLIPFLRVLEIRNVRTGETVMMQTISVGHTFRLGYLHSVELSLVWDFFSVTEDGQLLLYETRFESSNAGLPATINEGEKIVIEPEGIRIKNRRIVIPELQLWVEEKTLNTLVMNSKSVDLAAKAGSQLIQIRVVRNTLTGHILQGITNRMR